MCLLPPPPLVGIRLGLNSKCFSKSKLCRQSVEALEEVGSERTKLWYSLYQYNLYLLSVHAMIHAPISTMINRPSDELRPWGINRE